jgi:hypothetical protein
MERLDLQFYIDNSNKFLYMPIAKNAHTKLTEAFCNASWFYISNLAPADLKDLLANKNIFCVLRDPLERWITAFITCCLSIETPEGRANLPADSVKLLDRFCQLLTKDVKSSFIYFFSRNKFNLDWHTQLQIEYIQLIDLEKITFFYLNDNTGSQIRQWLASVNIDLPLDDKKINPMFLNRPLYVNLVAFLADPGNIEHKQKLLEYLQPDYNLINSVKFYAG